MCRNDKSKNEECKELIKCKKLFDDYKRLPDEYKNRYFITNTTLYKLCKKYIKHDCNVAIEAKLTLIGRTYAAAIERRNINKTEKYNDKDFIYDHIMKIFIKDDNKPTDFSKELDGFISKLNHNHDFNKNNIINLLTIHQKLIDKTYEYTKNKKISLYSKYLHFHCPKVAYMYDSRANIAIRKLINEKPKTIKCKDGEIEYNKENNNKEYFDFLACIAKLKEYLKKIDKNFEQTPRNIDDFLLWCADHKFKKNSYNFYI